MFSAHRVSDITLRSSGEPVALTSPSKTIHTDKLYLGGPE